MLIHITSVVPEIENINFTSLSFKISLATLTYNITRSYKIKPFTGNQIYSGDKKFRKFFKVTK